MNRSNTVTAKQLKRRLRSIQHKTGWSQRTLAAELGVSQGRVNQMLHATYDCGTSGAVVKLIEQIEIDIEEGRIEVT